MRVECGICRDRGRHHKERVTVRRRIHYRFGADIAASPRTILDNELLAELCGQPLPHQTCENVGRASRSKPNDDAHWPRRVTLRSCTARGCGQYGSTRYHMEKLSAGKLHD